MIKYSAILATTLCAFPALNAMELALTPDDKKNYKVPQGIINHHKLVQAVYTRIPPLLEQFKPDDSKCMASVITIIGRLQTLSLANPPVQAKELGRYFSEKNPKVEITTTLRQSFWGRPFTLSHISLVLRRCGHYLQHLKENLLTLPTKADMQQHIENEHIKTVAAKSASFGNPIKNSTIGNKAINLPDSRIGIIEFIDLMKHIDLILQEPPASATEIEQLNYADDDNQETESK